MHALRRSCINLGISLLALAVGLLTIPVVPLFSSSPTVTKTLEFLASPPSNPVDLSSKLTTIFFDDFNRANSTNLGSSWTERQGNFEISNNQIVKTGTAGGANPIDVAHTAAFTTANYSVQATLVNVNGTGGNDWFGVAGRRVNFDTTDSNMYAALVNLDFIYLYLRLDGSWTELGAAAITRAANDVIKLHMSGSTIKVFYNGVEKISVTDTTLTAPGDAALQTGTAGALDQTWDNFLVEHITPPTVTTLTRASNGDIYVGTNNGRFGKYVPGTDTFTDLTSKISSFWGSNSVDSLAFDSVNNHIYLGGSGRFARYSIGSDAATDLSSKLAGEGYNPERRLAFDAAQGGVVYQYGGWGGFARYNTPTYTGGGTYPTADTTYLLASKITAAFPSGFDVGFNATSGHPLAVDTTNKVVYLVSATGKFARYNMASYSGGGTYPTADTVYDLTGKLSGFSISTLWSVALSSDSTVAYLGGAFGAFARYNTPTYTGGGTYPTADTAYNFASKAQAVIGDGGPGITSITRDTANDILYLGIDAAYAYDGGFLKCESTCHSGSSNATDLRSKISSFWGVNSVFATIFDATNAMIYIGGAGGKFGKMPVGTGSTTGTDTTVYNSGSPACFDLAINIAETPTLLNAFIEVTGLAYNSSGNHTLNVAVQQNATCPGTPGAGTNYTVAGSTTPKHFKIIHDTRGGGSGPMANITASETSYTYAVTITGTGTDGVYSLDSVKAKITYTSSSSSSNQMKQTKFWVTQEAIVSTSASTITKAFDVTILEESPVIRTKFIEVTGVARRTAQNATAEISIVKQGNSASYRTYNMNLSSTAGAIVRFTVLYQIPDAIMPDIDFPRTQNYQFDFRGTGFDVFVLQAQAIIGYKYALGAGLYKASGTLDSSVFDTGAANGASFNSVAWNGTLNGGAVQFQIATSDCSNGATNAPTCDTGSWTFYGDNGSGCASSLYYDLSGTIGLSTGTPLLSCAASINNKRYFKYRVKLCSASNCTSATAFTPQLNDILVNWSP